MKCKKHPKYKAIRKPRCGCDDCWAIWKYKNGIFSPYQCRFTPITKVRMVLVSVKDK